MVIPRFSLLCGSALSRSYHSAKKGNRSMLMYLQILGTGSSEVSPSIFLFTETNRYLFNCSESVQTVCYEHGVKFSKLRNVFVTRMNWENVGGLPGLLMSLRDHTHSAKEATVHGPSSLHSFKSIATATFLNQESLTMNVNSCPLDNPLVYNSDELSVKGYEVFINKDEEDRVRKMNRGNEEDSPDPKQPCLQRNHEGSVVFYTCQLSKTVGKFHPEKAQALGVPKGVLYKNLVGGKAVVTPAGRTVFPLEVMDPDEPGPCFIVIECPSIGFIPRLIHHPQLQKGTTTNPDIIIHIAPRQVIEHELYREWFEGFGDKIRNVFVHREICKPEIVMRSCYKLQLPLNLIDSNIFHSPTVPFTKHSPITIDRPSCIAATTLMKLYLKPKSKYGIIEDNQLPPLEDCIQEYSTELKTNTDLLSKLEKRLPDVQKRLSNTSIIAHSKESSVLPTQSSVTFLGTASTVPSKYRSHSAILLHLPSSSGFMFLDCGEGTLGQLYKCFGEEVADYILANLKCVFVSHIHGDHHLGLIRLMQRRYNLLQQQQHGNDSVPPLLIIGPNILRRWLEEYRRSCEHLSFWFQSSKAFVNRSSEAIKHDTTSSGSPSSPSAALHQTLLELGFTNLSTVSVIHVQQSYGVVLVHREGWKLVYSGDTRPCDGLVRASGKGTSLLIHEATFDDSLQQEAISKRHSTMAEAMSIATAMNAEFTILTHFSQRYEKFSTAFTSKCMQNCAFAFDFMTVPIMRDNRQLENMQPLIHDIFKMLNFEANEI